MFQRYNDIIRSCLKGLNLHAGSMSCQSLYLAVLDSVQVVVKAHKEFQPFLLDLSLRKFAQLAMCLSRHVSWISELHYCLQYFDGGDAWFTPIAKILVDQTAFAASWNTLYYLLLGMRQVFKSLMNPSFHNLIHRHLSTQIKLYGQNVSSYTTKPQRRPSHQTCSFSNAVIM